MTSLYEERALEKHRALQTRATSLKLLTPPLQATVLLGFVLAGAGLAWATLARVPILVEGTGMVAPVDALRPVRSIAAGSALFRFDASGFRSPAWEAATWSLSRNPDSFGSAEIVALARELVAQPEYAQIPTVISNYVGRVPAGRLIVQIDSREEREKLLSALRTLQETERSTRILNAQQKAKNRILQQEQQSRIHVLQSMQKLQSSGYVSRQEILQEQATQDELRSTIYSNQSQIEQNNSARQSALSSLREALIGFIDRTLVFADADLYIQDVSVEQRGQVNAGQELLIASNRSTQTPRLVPAYLSNKEAAQTFPGMDVIASPIAVDRSQYGGIRGRVQAVAPVPSSQDEINARVGLESLADLILQRETTPTAIVVELLRDPAAGASSAGGGYLWTSRGGPPFPVKVGDQFDLQITTRSVRPIDLVLPFLRRLVGWTPPPSTGSSVPGKAVPMPRG